MLNIRRLISILFLIFFITLHSKAQERQYFIKLNGDTVYGKLKINTFLDNSKNMLFRTENKQRINLLPQRTKLVYHSKKFIFEPVIFKGRRLFMKRLYTGILKIYNYTRYEINSGSVMTSKIVKNKGLESVEVTSFGFKKQLSEYLKDCPEIEAKIIHKYYKMKNIFEMAEDYDNCSQKIVTTLKNINRESISEIEDYRTVIESSDLEKKDEVLEILKDIEKKILSEEDVPNYLWNALISTVKSNSELNEKAIVLQKSLTEN